MRKILIFIAVLLTGSLFVSESYSQEIRKNEDGIFTTGKIVDSIKTKSQNNINIKSASTLKGKIIITTSPDPNVKVSYVIKSKAESRSRAIDHIDLITVNLDRTASGIQVHLKSPNPAPWDDDEAAILEIEIIVPDSSEVEITASYFDVTGVGPFSKMIIPSSLGRLTISDVTKELELATTVPQLFA